jgi:hypothetical protein
MNMTGSVQKITNSEESIYKILDQVIETGKSVTVERKGKRLIISPSLAVSKLDKLEEHPGFITGDHESIVHIDWSSGWEPCI